jgi:hypothetical protein
MELQISRWHESRGFKFGAGIGALVLTYTGAAWAFAALGNRAGVTPRWEFGMLTVPVLLLTIFGVIRLVAVAKLPVLLASDPEAIEGARRGRRVGLLFGVVFAVEFGSIALAAILLSRAGRPLLIPVVIVAIVGAHFLPLARIFHVPTYGFAGVLLVLAALGSLLITDEPARVFALGMVTGLVLWVSAATVLALHTGRQSLVAGA